MGNALFLTRLRYDRESRKKGSEAEILTCAFLESVENKENFLPSTLKYLIDIAMVLCLHMQAILGEPASP